MTEKTDHLMMTIESSFPYVDMPPSNSLISTSAIQRISGDDLTREIEEYRGKPISAELIRSLHQELHNLSAEAWNWILPHYLRYCMSPTGLDSRTELEYLIYKLDPKPDFSQETKEHLALLTKQQIKCLIDIIQWCILDDYWSEYFPDDLRGAMQFLRNLYKTRST